MWRMRLGFIAQNMRYRGNYFNQFLQDYEKIEEIGFVCNAVAAKWKNRFLPALETYVCVHGDANFPDDYVVPSEDLWPQKTYGLQLGKFVANEKQQSCFAEFIAIDRAQLQELGFLW
ncbi:hypothetical protein P3T76_009893 [Phytophthora citrophthora]|uniref:Uncharacterized protein n=1 Tax=Phytophthora citrophthora TaxID=4793 RepID=A0AAD9LHY8_9STRA|nr:hypothetical protein P3T76_009893 [Phytophthora citrophthora]